MNEAHVSTEGSLRWMPSSPPSGERRKARVSAEQDAMLGDWERLPFRKTLEVYNQNYVEQLFSLLFS